MGTDPGGGARSISVVIPVRNGESTIRLLLDDLVAESAVLERLEILVCDNGSTDGTRSVVDAAARDLGHPIDVVDASLRRGPAFAMNVGAARATGEALFFIGADDRVDRGTLRALADRVAPGVVAVPSLEIVSPGCATPYRACAQVTELAQLDLTTPSGILTVPFFYDGFMMIRREDFERAGGFDDSMLAGEDADFSIRCADAGISVVFVAEARGRYVLKSNAGSVFRTGRTQGVAAVLIDRRLGPDRQLVQRPMRRQVLGSVRAAVTRHDRSSVYGALFQLGRVAGRLEQRWFRHAAEHY